MSNFKSEATFLKEEVDTIYQEKKILIVDDDIITGRSIIQVLKKNPGYNILATSNGELACKIAMEEVPDLIIMDWKMPVMDGIDATKWLRQNDVTKDIPVIIATGVMMKPSELSAALLAGAFDFLCKPVNEVELTARVANMLCISESYLQIKRQKEELVKQLTSQLIRIQQLNELKSETVKHLTHLKDHISGTENQSAKEIIYAVESLLQSKVYQVNWDELELHFEYMFQGFFNRLKAICVNLTPNELRLSAFIKLNMRNKEIAKITFTMPDTVNMARKRLKKKLGLLPGESLHSFISNL